LLGGVLVEQVTESRDPVLVVAVGIAQCFFRDPGPAKALDLLFAAQFFDPKVGWVDRMRIDQDGRSIRTVEMPARPSIAAAVEPARPPPMTAISV
jgi:hypothetical protein